VHDTGYLLSFGQRYESSQVEGFTSPLTYGEEKLLKEILSDGMPRKSMYFPL
jgi:hypothetical protein